MAIAWELFVLQWPANWLLVDVHKWNAVPHHLAAFIRVVESICLKQMHNFRFTNGMTLCLICQCPQVLYFFTLYTSRAGFTSCNWFSALHSSAHRRGLGHWTIIFCLSTKVNGFPYLLECTAWYLHEFSKSFPGSANHILTQVSWRFRAAPTNRMIYMSLPETLWQYLQNEAETQQRMKKQHSIQTIDFAFVELLSPLVLLEYDCIRMEIIHRTTLCRGEFSNRSYINEKICLVWDVYVHMLRVRTEEYTLQVKARSVEKFSRYDF